MFYPRTFRSSTGCLFTYREATRILLGLNRLLDRGAIAIDWALKEELRTAYHEICRAAEQVERDLERAFRTALIRSDEKVEARVLCERECRLDDTGLDVGIRDRIWALRLALGDLRADRAWREALISPRDGKLTVRKAMASHPAVRNALRSGFLTMRDTPSRNRHIRKALAREMPGSVGREADRKVRQLVLDRAEERLLVTAGTRWLHLLEDNTRIRRIAIQVVISDPTHSEGRGRRQAIEVKRFVQTFVEICERFSGSPATVSLHETSPCGELGGAVRASAEVEFLNVCLEVLGYPVGLERCKELLLEAKKSSC